jgi:hypothetical protein
METLYTIEAFIHWHGRSSQWTRTAFTFRSMLAAELFALGNFKSVKTRVVPYGPEAR